MRYAGIAIIVAGALGCCAQQRSAFEHQDECIDPRVESMGWRTVEGEIASVAPDGELRLANPPRRVRIVATAINLPAADAYLKALVGKHAVVSVNPQHADDESVTGIVSVDGNDVGRALLARGWARYAAPEAYSISDYTDCLYRIEDREAAKRRAAVSAAGHAASSPRL